MLSILTGLTLYYCFKNNILEKNEQFDWRVPGTMHYIQQDAFSYTHKPMELSPWSRVDIHPHLPNFPCSLECVRRALCARFTRLTHFKCVLEYCWLAAACCRVHPQNWLVLQGWDFTVAENNLLPVLTPGSCSMHHPYESHFCRYLPSVEGHSVDLSVTGLFYLAGCSWSSWKLSQMVWLFVCLFLC